MISNSQNDFRNLYDKVTSLLLGFYGIVHNILLDKLHHYGVRATAISLLKNYLDNRKIRYLRVTCLTLFSFGDVSWNSPSWHLSSISSTWLEIWSRKASVGILGNRITLTKHSGCCFHEVISCNSTFKREMTHHLWCVFLRNTHPCPGTWLFGILTLFLITLTSVSCEELSLYPC